jgi:RNA-directed DNA polymerase
VRRYKVFEYLRKFRENFPKRKFYQLIDKVYSMDNLEEAWKRVKANKGCAGIDKQTINEFWPYKAMHFRELQRQIKTGTYKATPILRKYIPKSDGKYRPLGIPTVKDRVLQQATKNVVEPIFEMKFLDCSYGFRPDRNAHQAITQISEYLQEGFTWIIDADLKTFFDTVEHALLMKLLAKEISDGKVLSLIESWLKAGVLSEGKLVTTKEGTPQGGVISPLLANIYLHEFDKSITRKINVRLVRYADDFVVMCKTKWMAQKTMESIKRLLARLKLKLNKEKTKIVNSDVEDFCFLGFKFRNIRGKRRYSPKKIAIEKFKDSVKQITGRKQPVKPEDMIGRLNQTIRGWGNYFKIGEVRVLYKQLDVWIHTRVRTFIEKKKSNYARKRITNHTLKTKYKLASLNTLIKPHTL